MQATVISIISAVMGRFSAANGHVEFLNLFLYSVVFWLTPVLQPCDMAQLLVKSGQDCVFGTDLLGWWRLSNLAVR